jgi:prepilin-type N-terminal cleavage/methylation domain-containing protein
MRKQKGFSLIELLIVVAIILIIAAIAVPNLLRSRIAANEASAAASLRTMGTAMVTYFSTYNIGFPSALANLQPSASATSVAADLLDSVLSVSPTKSGYVFTYTVGGGTPPSQFVTTASPQSPGSSGVSSFCMNETNVVRKDPAGGAVVTTSLACSTFGSPL